MNQHDRRDLEVRNYVRDRMAGEIPPEFVGNVMNDVNRTTQRTRGPAWPMFATFGTVMAAALAVIVGLNVLNSGGVGSQPSPSASASGSATTSESAAPTASGSVEPSASASAEATPGDGEFGPIHSMAPEDAFPNAQACETGPLIANAEPTGLSYSIAFPESWFTNESTENRSACTLFDAEPFGAPDDQTLLTVAIVADVSPGGDLGIDGPIISTAEYTIDGVAALRYELGPSDGGFSPDPAVLWVVAIGGNLPSEGNDRPFIIIQTVSSDPATLAASAEILDRMMATLDIGAE